MILASIGFVILSFGATNLARDYRSLHWPSTQGIIMSASMTQIRQFGSHKSYFSADVQYDYQVGGVSYTGSQVSFGGFWGRSESHARQILDRYPKGKQVAVFYAPDKPEAAVLEPQITDRTWTPLAFGVFFLLWGTLPMIIFISRA